MYGPFVPDMYSRDFIHYDKFSVTDPILERPITTTGYSDLVSSPTGGYEMIQPNHTPRIYGGSTVYKERFETGMSSGIRFILISTFLTLTIYFFMQIIGSHFGSLNTQTYFILFLVFSVLWLMMVVLFKDSRI